MNVVLELLYKYFRQEAFTFSTVIVIIFVLNIIQTNFLSSITANIIDAVEHGKYQNVFNNLRFFGAISIVYLLLYGTNEMIQMGILTKLTQWLRRELFEYLVKSNNEDMSQINMLTYNTPINRASYTIYSMVHSILNYLLTNFAFIIIICIYFTYNYTKFGSIFTIANALILVYIYFNLDKLRNSKMESDEAMMNNENIILDMFNNFDKIIYRGESNNEMKRYKQRSQDCIDKTIRFYNMTNTHSIVLTTYIYCVLFLSVVFLIALHQSKKIDNKLFITLFTILLLYREKSTTLIQLIPTFLEFETRYQTVLAKLKRMNDDDKTVILSDRKYKIVDLEFNKIEFKNVSFKYTASSEPILQNYNLVLNTNNKIIGITGISGKGKSTIMKLLIKLYTPDSGDILVDGVSIKDIDPEYIRKYITYVNQNSRLFDRKVIDNIMYGCINPEKCDDTLKFILKYPKIQLLFKGVDIYTKEAGSLGENLSGGQRQIINIISGLVNPSKILILDEPTNALDGELKKELVRMVKDFRKQKKSIIIITHDKEVYPIFDEKLDMK